MSKKDFQEADLYAPAKTFFEERGYEVKAEVNNCDLVAISEDEVVCVEMKKQFNFEVILQAVQRQRICDKVYIVVPRPEKGYRNKRWNNIRHLVRRLELGVLLIINPGTARSYAIEEAAATPFDRRKSSSSQRKAEASLISEFQSRHGDNNVGGVCGEKIITAYREKCLKIAFILEQTPCMTPKQLREAGTDAEKTLSILEKNFYGWFKKERRGVYSLNADASDELDDYRYLADSLNIHISREALETRLAKLRDEMSSIYKKLEAYEDCDVAENPTVAEVSDFNEHRDTLFDK